MKLTKQWSRDYGDKEYHKYLVVLPSKIIKELGWKGGEDLEAETKNDKLIITKNDKTRVNLIAEKKKERKIK